MRVNTRLSNSNGNLFDIIEIKYALLGCLAFTNKEDKLREMLLYVLLCSASLDDKLSGEHSIFDIIDHMTCIIGQDYKNCKGPARRGGHAPAEILCSLDKESRMTLFRYMNNSNNEIAEEDFFGQLSTKLRTAQQKLEEKLVCEYGDVRGMRVFQPRVYLKLLDDYLSFRLNNICLHIAREIYNTIHR